MIENNYYLVKFEARFGKISVNNIFLSFFTFFIPSYIMCSAVLGVKTEGMCKQDTKGKQRLSVNCPDYVDYDTLHISMYVSVMMCSAAKSSAVV